MFVAARQILETEAEKAKKLIYKCLWLIRTTLDGIMFPNERIEPLLQYP
jgi:hypothetical protein